MKSPEDPHLCRHRQGRKLAIGCRLFLENFRLQYCRLSRNSGPVLRLHLNEAEGSLRLSGRMRFFEFVDRLQDIELSAATDDHGIDYAAIAGFTRAIQVIRQDYVDRSAVSYKKLTYAALHAMLPHLDPHSQFLEPEDLKDREDETRGEFGGFGFTISRKDQAVTVLSTMENSPSARAGILPGDQIVAVAGKSTLNMPIEDLNQLLRGQPNQRLALTIYRPSTKETKDYEMRREMIKVASVVDAKILNPEETGGIKIGYLRITEFTEPTARELSEKLDSLRERRECRRSSWIFDSTQAVF